jgi:hypothetical protein
MSEGGQEMSAKNVSRSESQSDKFKQAALDLECDDDPARFDERMKKLAKQKPVEKPE